MSTLTTAFERQQADERARAIRTLLARPLLTAPTDPATFALIVAHRVWLRAWFDEQAGWDLHVEPRQRYARLVKRRHDPPATRPARRVRTGRQPFDRRRYALLCVTLAELTRGHTQTTIGMLASRVAAACADDDVLRPLDTSVHGHRAAFVDVLTLLESWQVITTEAGDSETFRTDTDAKVLYTVDETRLVRLVAAATPPSRAADDAVPLEVLTTEPRYGPDPAAATSTERIRNMWARHRLLRRLLDDPAVYPHELDPAEAAYLASPTGGRVVRRALDDAGLTLETRADGWVIVDPDAIAALPNDRFPDERSHVKHAALLLLECASGARHGPDADRDTAGPPAAPVSRLVDHVQQLMGRFPTWVKKYQGPGGAGALTDAALELLIGHKLAMRENDVVVLLPAAARYASVTAAQLVIDDDPVAPAAGSDRPADPEPRLFGLAPETP